MPVPATMALSCTPSWLASLRPLVSSSCETSATVVPSISQYTNTLFMSFSVLSDNLFVQQLSDEALNVSIAACQCLTFLGLEHNVLHGLHLGGRACQTTL